MMVQENPEGVSKIPVSVSTHSWIEVPSTLTSVPCSSAVMASLARIYFIHFHPHFPMVDEEDFMYRLALSENPLPFVNLQLAMVSLVTLYVRSIPEINFHEGQQVHETCLKRLRLMAANTFDFSHIYSVQCLVLMSQIGFYSFDTYNSWFTGALAVRMAQELGLHRRLKKFNLEQHMSESMIETMNRTWYCCYILDRHLSMIAGRPMMVRDAEFETEMPKKNWGFSGPTEYSKSSVVYFAREVGIAKILGHVVSLANAMYLTERSAPAYDIHIMLNDWFNHLPPESQMLISNCPGDAPWTMDCLYGVWYYTARLILYRLGHTKSAADVPLRMLRLVQRIPPFDKTTLFHPALLCYGITILSLTVLTDSTSVDVPFMTTLLEVLIKMEQRYTCAYRMRLLVLREMKKSINVDSTFPKHLTTELWHGQEFNKGNYPQIPHENDAEFNCMMDNILFSEFLSP